MTPKQKNSGVLIALLLLFVGPVLVAYVMNVFAPQWQPFGHVNRGILLQPARKLGPDTARVVGGHTPERLFQGTWTLAFVADPECGSTCQLSLIELHQAKLALGKETGRLRQMLLFRSGAVPDFAAPLEVNPELTVGIMAGGWRQSLSGAAPDNESYILLIDPQGYAVMRYAADADGSGVLKDLKRLLKISKIG